MEQEEFEEAIDKLFKKKDRPETLSEVFLNFSKSRYYSDKANYYFELAEKTKRENYKKR